MAYDKLFQYYAREQFLPTFGNLENAGKLAQYTDARRTVFAEKLMLPIQMFDGADVLEFGPDTGENALVFAQWGAKVTLAEPNLRAHGQIRHRSARRFAQDDGFEEGGERHLVRRAKRRRGPSLEMFFDRAQPHGMRELSPESPPRL
jgi:hypothetical protein